MVTLVKTPVADAAKQATTQTSGNADLDALQSLADKTDAEHSDAIVETDAAGQPPELNYKVEASKCVDMIAAMMLGYCPPTATVWTEDKKTAVSAALAPVLEKYGVTMAAMPCELVLVFVAGPALYASAKLVATQMKVEQIANRVQASQAPAVEKKPGETGNAPAAPTHPQTALYK